jgi:putative copper export protein
MIFLTVVLVPVERGICDSTLRFELVNKIGIRFKYIGWIAIAILALTGLFIALIRVPSWEALFGTRYGRTLVAKLILVSSMVVLSAIHDFYLGPRVVESAKKAQKIPRELRILTYLARGNLALGLLVIYLALSLRTGGLNIFY